MLVNRLLKPNVPKYQKSKKKCCKSELDIINHLPHPTSPIPNRPNMPGMEMKGRSGNPDDDVQLVSSGHDAETGGCCSCWTASCTKPLTKKNDVPLWDKRK